MIRAFRKYKSLLALVIIIIVLICIMGYLVFIRIRVTDIGGSIGTVNGKIVGTAIGSYKGITVGIEEGIKAGEEAGLDASDTFVNDKIEGSVTAVGNLEVLVAGVRLKNLHEIGDSYKALYMIKGDAIFTVNLSDASISFSADGRDVYIHIPEPTVELVIDESNTEKLAEYQKFSWTASAREGIVGYINSQAMIEENAKETINDYDGLMENAKDSAIFQVETLVKSLCDENMIVHVEFKQ